MPIIADQLGRVLKDRYLLEAALGTGASAHVFLARDLELGRQVAVKLLHPGLANDEQFYRRFRAEARAAAALNHSNIVQIYDWGEDGGEPFLVLEYLAGGSLRDVLDREGKLGLSEVAQIGSQAARGIEYAHSRGLVHRDIKPANLLFDEHGVIHVADFGLARALADAAWTEPVGVILGTARYTSPEQIKGEDIDGHTDVYSLALVCYEAVVGQVPFPADTTFATLMARVNTPLDLPPELGPLAQVIRLASATNPIDRLDASEFARQLDRLAALLPAPRPIAVSSNPVDAYSPASILPGDLTIQGNDGTEIIRPNEPVDIPNDELVAAEVARNRASQQGRHRQFLRFGIVAAVALLIATGITSYIHFGVYGNAVPKFVGVKTADVSRMVKDAGLHLGAEQSAFSATVPAGEIIEQSLKAGAHVKAGTVIALTVSKGHAPVVVPSAINKPLASAESILKASQFEPHVSRAYNETVQRGTVISQTPASGTAAFGSAVQLSVSKGPAPRTIPDLSGEAYADARSALIADRLVPKQSRAYSTSVSRGDVISTSPIAGTTGVAVGSMVGVVVSRGPQVVAVPTVAGASIADAVAAIQAAGLQVSEQIGPPFATTATTTNPPAGTLLAPGSSVTLYVA